MMRPPTLAGLLRRRSNISGAILRREAAELLADGVQVHRGESVR